MPKIPDCNRCILYAHNPSHLVCAVHPDGLKTDKCLDFRPDKDADMEKQWSPQGYSWYGDELIPDCEASRRHRPSRYTAEEQLEILNNHPFFTGVCPQCRHRFNRNDRIIYYDCPSCGWVDNSV